ncbi:transcription factor CP2-like isoform X2 [Xenia sp. Carnegie-2017]|uniref:transcription factor CP2-like isoform X2 n=1 Tax=Xenia sp. Carnegie-2017 TaxID=2897299 RepID=UPI001F03FAE9|nr:transcription factor CP2-like isoform X2 [Xenia sp. Carnegie-2017]
MSSTNWREDELDKGLAADLFNLSGLGVGDSQIGAYDMTEVLNLVKEPSLLNVTQDNSQFNFLLNAPTSSSKKLNEDSITYLNQGQSYLVRLQALYDMSFANRPILSVVAKLGFYERKLQVVETEKYEEWLANRPTERILEIDMPMSVGILNVRTQGSYKNELEFEWDTQVEAQVYIKINCVSSEFTKGKSGGESGVPLKLQFDIQDTKSQSILPLYSAGCQIKVFRTKGADRKHKTELSKLEQLSKEEIEQYQPQSEVTILTENLFGSPEIWSSPTNAYQNFLNSSVQSPTGFYSPNTPSAVPVPVLERITPESTIDETRTWLAHHRFQGILPQLNNYTGADLLRLSKKDITLIAGNAEGIRLHNLLQIRATKPVLTMYVCVESMQDSSTMKEYQAVYLETLTLKALKEKLAQKCNLQSSQISAVFREGPTGIKILVNDEMVANLADEMSFIVDVIRDEHNNLWRIMLK